MLPTSTEPPCYEQEGSLCRWVYQQTGENEAAANVTNWFIDIPLRVLLVLLIAVVASWLVRRWVQRLVERSMGPRKQALGKVGIDLPAGMMPRMSDPRREARANSVSTVVTSTLVVTIWVIALITVLGMVGIDLGPLIAGAGIAGVALGFGAQALVKDCIAGLFMLIEDQYGLGDVVDLGEAIGTVEEITLRATVLRSLDGTVWHVPNGVVQRVGNMSQLWSVALIDVDVAYDTDLERARGLLLAAATDVCEREEFAGSVLEPPSVLGVETLGADGITLRLTAKVEPGSQWAIQRAIREQVKVVYDSEEIEIPFPQRTIWVRTDDDGAATSDAAGTTADPTGSPAPPRTAPTNDPPTAGDDGGE